MCGLLSADGFQSFFIDLDLTTTSGGRREPLKRRKLGPPPVNEVGVPGTSDQARSTSASTANFEAQAENEVDPDAVPGPTVALPPAKDIQILDLPGRNPVISYQNQIYHCTWSDMIGTLMFFSKPEGNPDEALLSTHDYDLINTSRIKLIGQRAKLAGKSGRKRPRPDNDEQSDGALADGLEDEADSILNGKSLGEIRTANAKINADIKKQAAFLEKLMDVKRSKGETDNVRTVFSQRKGGKRAVQAPDIDLGSRGLKEGLRSQPMEREIEKLNRMVVRGDATALKRLQDIYSNMEDDVLNRASPTPGPAAEYQES